MRLCAALLALLLAACAGAPLPFAPQPRESADSLLHQSPWLKTQLLGITLYANTTPDQTRRVVTKLARFLDLVQRLGGNQPFEPDRPVEIFIFARASQWQHFGDELSLGHAQERPAAYRLGMSAEWNAYDVLLHELVHLALFVRPGRDYPRWYHEGLAEVLSSAVIREDVAVLGRILELRSETLEDSEPMPLDTLLSGRAADSQALVERFYADAFAFVYYGLLSDQELPKPRSKEFNAFVARLRGGADWRAAFDASFSDDLDAIQQEFERTRERLTTRDVLRAVVVDLDRPVPAFTLEPVGDAEIARALARFGEEGQLEPALAAALWQVALEAGPGDVAVQLGRARALAAQGDGAAAAAQLAAVPRAQADEAEYAATAAAVYQAEGRFDAARDAYEQVLELRPEDLAAQIALGLSYVADPKSDAQRGIEILTQVDAVWPEQPEIQLALASLYARSGDYHTARSPRLRARGGGALRRAARARRGAGGGDRSAEPGAIAPATRAPHGAPTFFHATEVLPRHRSAISATPL